MKNTWLALVLLAALPAVSHGGEYVKNPQFDPAKPPLMDEAKPQTPGIDKRWEKISAPPRCEGKSPVWGVSTQSKLTAMAYKDGKIGVPGEFKRFVASGSPQGGALKGRGTVNMASWDSGVPARDYRVMKYVFGVEDRKLQTLDFEFSISPWVMDQPHAAPKMTVQFTFRGKKAELALPVDIRAEGRAVRVISTQSPQFSFLTQAARAAFLKLMDLCNHQSLGAFAEPAVDLVFEPVCPPAAAK